MASEPQAAAIMALRAQVAKLRPDESYTDITMATDCSKVQALLAAYDQQTRDLDAFGHAISDQSRRAQEAETRAERAEAVIERVRRYGESRINLTTAEDILRLLRPPDPTPVVATPALAAQPPADPPFLSLRAAQFVSGFQAATRAIEADQ